MSNKTGAVLIAEERLEQIEKHGWSLENDSCYINKELTKAAVFCICQELGDWPEGWNQYFKDKILQKNRIDQLKVAGAFIAAEIDRLQLNYNL